mgnify:CR=1 FL=1
MSRATTVLLRSSSSSSDSSSDSRFRRFSRRVPSSLSLLLCHLSLCVRVNRRVLFLTTMRACTAIVRKKEKKKKKENENNVNTPRRGNKRVNITPKRGSHSGFEGKSRAYHEKTVTFYCSHFIPAQTSLIYLVTSTANTRSFSAFACCRSG